jgi:cytochrome P450
MSDGAAGQIYFNPYDESFRANPYPHYVPMLAGGPWIVDSLVPMAIFARYVDVLAVLRDHDRFSSVQPASPLTERRKEVFGDTATILFSDPPVHSRLRRIVSRAFTARRIRNLEPHIRSLTAQLLDRVAVRGELELMADLAVPLPVMVIAKMLGVPPELYETFKRWSDIIVEGDNEPPTLPLPISVKTAFDELVEYLRTQVERRRINPGDDLISLLVAAHEEDDALSEAEVVAFVVILLLAGNETTTNLIGNGTLALGRHPDQLERLRCRPDLLPNAIEEMLRYDSPAQSAIRFAHGDFDFNGVRIRKGSFVFAVLAAANRDPAQFSDPDRFDITRDPNEHLAFGAGNHFCLGAALGRMEAMAAFGGMLQRFPRLRLADPAVHPSYKGSYFLRGLAELRLSID